MNPMADVFPVEHIHAQWAYSELLSPGHGHFYRGPGFPELKEKARQHEPFQRLTLAERSMLALGFNRARGGYFNEFFTGITTFKLEQWTKDQLGAAIVIGYFVRELGMQDRLGMTFKEWIETLPERPLDEHHPRNAANSAFTFIQTDPVTFGRRPRVAAPVLLDGYHRAVRFWCNKDPTMTLAAYVPTEQ
jgi:hypothetical protein